MVWSVRYDAAQMTAAASNSLSSTVTSGLLRMHTYTDDIQQTLQTRGRHACGHPSSYAGLQVPTVK